MPPIEVVSTSEAPVLASASTGVAESEPKEETQASAPVADQAAEQKETTESDTAETEAKEDDQDESEESDESTETKDSDKDKPKKKSGSQRRKERAERAEAEVARLQKLVEDMAFKNAGESKTEKVETKPAQVVDGRPKPDDYETHVDYVDALTDWKIDQREKAKEVDQQKSKLVSEQETLLNSHRERVKSFAEKTPDWADALAEVDDIIFSAAATQVITESDLGPELIYELAKNRTEAERIAKLPPLAAARELGKIEAKLSLKASEPKQEIKKTTKAPQPITPVGSKGGSVEKSIHDPNLSQREYEALRAKQRSA